MNTFEIIGFGFDGSSDETDDRVLWVRAKTHAVVRQAIAGTSATFEVIDDSPSDIDFVLPDQLELLKLKLQSFEANASQLSAVVEGDLRATAPRG